MWWYILYYLPPLTLPRCLPLPRLVLELPFGILCEDCGGCANCCVACAIVPSSASAEVVSSDSWLILVLYFSLNQFLSQGTGNQENLFACALWYWLREFPSLCSSHSAFHFGKGDDILEGLRISLRSEWIEKLGMKQAVR